MIVELLTLGDELLDGRRVDTNTAWLGRKFTAMGTPPRFRQTVSDRMGDIVEAFRVALKRSDFIVSTGGLGPTADDLTFEALALALNRPLKFHSDIFEGIQKRFAQKGLRCPDSNRRQAMLPEGSVEIANEWGTAPGIRIEEQGKLLFALPGVPVEMENLFDRGVKGEFEKRMTGGRFAVERIFKFVGLPESYVEEGVNRCRFSEIGGVDFRIAYTASFPQIDVTLSVTEKSPGRLEAAILEAEQRLETEMGKFLVVKGNQTLEEKVISSLRSQNRTLSIAESITGGAIASQLVNVSGSSEVFLGGLVTYSNQSKIKLLGVLPETIETFGAVSEECAIEMVKGVRKQFGSNESLATTGIAGPEGGSEKKPVGLTYIAWFGPDLERPVVKRFEFRWDRNRNRMMATYEALKGLLMQLKK